MAVQEYGVRQSDGTWQVWHRDALMSCHTTYLAALRAAEVLSRQATSHGQRSKIVVGPVGGVRVEFPDADPERGVLSAR